MDIIKWFERQKPITLGLIIATFCFILIIIGNYFIDVGLDTEQILKFALTISSLMFFLSFLMCYQVDRSIKIFKEIEELYYHTKKAKTEVELLKVNSDYIDLRNKAEHSGHYARLNTVKAILETKQEFYNASKN